MARRALVGRRHVGSLRAGLTIRPELPDIEPGELPIHHRAIEEAVLDLIDERESSPKIERVAA